LYNADGTLDVDEADGGTEVSVICNEGAETTATNDFADEGTFYSIALTATEMQCERIAVVVAATTTEVFFIQTIDNTSAMTPTIVQTGDSFARLGAPAGASVSADIAAIEAQTDDIGVAGAGLTAIDLPNQTMDITGTISTVTSVTNAVTANMTQISGDSAAADKLETAFDLTAGPVEPLGIVRQGTAQSASATGLVLDSSAAFADDTGIGMTLVACGSTQGYCQSRTVTDNALSGDAFTVDTWTVTPSGTITYYLFGTAPASGSSAPTASQVADAVWDEATSGHATAGTFGVAVTDILTDTSTTLDDLVDDLESRLGTPSNLGGGATVAANLSDIEGQTDDIGVAGAGLTAADDAVMTRLGAPAGASVSADVAAVKSDTAATLLDTGTDGVVVATGSKTGYALSAAGVDAIWDEAQAGHVTAGTFGLYLDSAISGVSTGGVSAGDIADAVWDEATSGHATAGTFGVGVTDILADTSTTLDDLVDDLESRLGTPSNLGGGATVSANLSDVESQTDDIGVAGAGLTAADDAALAAIAALNDLTATDIRDIVIEDQGSTVSLGCALAAILAYAGGDLATSGGTSTYEDPSGTETRISGTVASAGNRAATITCPTY
jgi:cytochrome c556